MQVATLLLCIAAVAAQESSSINPVTRVAKLMQDLSQQIESEGKDQKSMYEKFECWCKKVQKDKATTIAASNVKVQQLSKYIDDVESGRVDFTDERKRLEAQIQEVKSDIESLNNNFDKQLENDTAQMAELEKTIAALQKAVDFIAPAIEGHKTGVLASVRYVVSKVIKQASAFDNVESSNLQRLMENPEWDWNNLNKKSTFKGKYRARSQKIFATLEKMHKTFSQQESDLKTKMAEDLKNFGNLKSSKEAELEEVVKARNLMAEENGSRGMAVSEAKGEVKALKEGVAADETIVETTKSTCADKEKEWLARQKSRSNELAAIAEAISILRNDDARDTFQSSFKSQIATSFVQTQETEPRVHKAASLLRVLAKSSSDSRLDGLSAVMMLKSQAGPVEKMGFKYQGVIDAIDNMLQKLQTEKDTDLEQKEICENKRTEYAVTSKDTSKEMDTGYSFIDNTNSEIASLEQDVKATNLQIAQLQQDLQEATDIRTSEHNEYLKNRKVDTNAKAIVAEAIEVLKGKTQWTTALVQQPIAAGKLPPPPPATFEGEYEGKRGEGHGVLSMLDTIENDIQDDMNNATAAEEKATKAFEEFKAETKQSIKDKTAFVALSQKTIAEKEDAITNSKADIGADKELLDAALKSLQTIKRDCDYLAVNFETRIHNRQAEVDGLQKAKDLLLGADFDFADPNRVMRPGDAFLQPQ